MLPSAALAYSKAGEPRLISPGRSCFVEGRLCWVKSVLTRFQNEVCGNRREGASVFDIPMYSQAFAKSGRSMLAARLLSKRRSISRLRVIADDADHDSAGSKAGRRKL